MKLSSEGKFHFKFDELVGCSAFALCMRTEKKKKISFVETLVVTRYKIQEDHFLYSSIAMVKTANQIARLLVIGFVNLPTA